MARLIRVELSKATALFTLATLLSIVAANASSFSVLHSFAGNADGCLPVGGVVLDTAGNLYGVTHGGGGGLCGVSGSWGTVFEIPKNGSETVLYSFPGGSGGWEPSALVLDNEDNLWGTTIEGGLAGGLIFEIITSRDKEKVIYEFGEDSQHDGCDSEGAMVANGSNDFFGTTLGCGKYNSGTVFELKPHGHESLRYSFKGGGDGSEPLAGPIIDSDGNLYGTTQFGGRVDACIRGTGCGTIFRLSPDGKKTELYKFKDPPGDGEDPTGTLLLDSSGNLYGTTFNGGRAGGFANNGCGIAFKLAPDGTETVLHFFTGRKGDGASPAAGLIADAAGNLYGTTEIGGGKESCGFGIGCGTVFEIAPNGTETILHKFKKTADGAQPIAGLVADSSGNLYGAAAYGGAYGYGTVFEITP